MAAGWSCHRRVGRGHGEHRDVAAEALALRGGADPPLVLGGRAEWPVNHRHRRPPDPVLAHGRNQRQFAGLLGVGGLTTLGRPSPRAGLHRHAHGGDIGRLTAEIWARSRCRWPPDQHAQQHKAVVVPDRSDQVAVAGPSMTCGPTCCSDTRAPRSLSDRPPSRGVRPSMLAWTDESASFNRRTVPWSRRRTSRLRPPRWSASGWSSAAGSSASLSAGWSASSSPAVWWAAASSGCRPSWT